METRKRLLLITGAPSVGKTTLVSKLIFGVRSMGLSVGGVYSKESRHDGRRNGFVMVDLLTGSRAVLASLTGEGPRLGRYHVDLTVLGEFVPKAISGACEVSDLVVVDEVGPMELLSPEFRRSVESLVNGSRPSLLVVHRSMHDPLVDSIKARGDATLVEVTLENRDRLPRELTPKVTEMVRS